MVFLAKIGGTILPVFIFFSWQLVDWEYLQIPQLFFLQLAIFLTFFIVAVRSDWKDRVFMIFLPLVFFIFSFAGIIFLENTLIILLLKGLVAFMLYILLRILFDFYYAPVHYQAYSLERVSSFLHMISGFLIFSALEHTVIFLSVPLWQVTIPLALLLFFLVAHYFSSLKIKFSRHFLYAISIMLIMMEMLLAVSFLPTGVYVNAFLLTLTYAILLFFSQVYVMEHKIAAAMIGKMTIFYAIMWTLTLLTAQWE